MYQQFSIKKIYMISLALFLLGSTIVATAATSAVFIAGRAVAGVGGAGLTAGAFIIVTQIMPLRKRPVFMSLLGTAEGVAIIVAPIIGGVLTESLSWRWCFYINLPIGGLALITIALLFSNPRPGEGTNLSLKQKLDQLDIIGNFFFIPSMTLLFLILSWAGIKFSWTDPKIIGLFVVFGVLLVAFIYTQYLRGDKATLPSRIFKQRSVMAGFVFITCMSGAMSVVAYYLPTYFQTVLGYSPAASGYLLLPFMIAFLVAVLVHGALTSVLGYYTPFMIVGSILAPIAAGLLTTLKVQPEIVRTLIYGGLAGFGAGLGIQAPQSAVQCALPAADVPIGLSFVTFGQQFGSALFVALAQTILSNQLATNLQRFDPDLTAKAIGNMGIVELKHSLTQHGRLQEVLSGLDESLTQTWYPVVGLAGVTIFGSLAMEWRSVKEKRN